MQLLPNDIIVRNYKDGETVWVSQRLVMQVCGVTDVYLRKVKAVHKKSIQHNYKYGDFLPNTGNAWRWGKVNGTFYYDFDCLPDRKPTHYRSKFGTKHELLQKYEALQSEKQQNSKEQIVSLIKQQVKNIVDNTHIRYFLYDAPIGFNQTQATEMATARAWCIWLNQQIVNENYKKLGIYKVGDLYQICTEILTPLNLEGLRVKSADYLRQKVDKFPIAANAIEQLNFFINGRYGNDNAKIVGKYPLVDESTGQIYNFDIHQALMFQLYMSPGSSTKEYMYPLHQCYIEDVKEFGMIPISYRTFCHHLIRFNKQVVMARSRHGQEYYRKNVETYVTTEKLKYAHSLFAGDGSGTINYKYKKSNGKWSTMKLYVILITDVASRYIAGWSVAPIGSHKETDVMTKTAVKMAIENGGKQTFFEFVSDNHGAFTSGEAKEFLNLAFNKVRTIEAGNSQANPAETQFRLFKRSLKDIKNFVSTSWDAGLENQANPDHLDLKELPTYDDAIIQFHELVNRWNNTALRDGVTPAERFENKNPHCQPMEATVLRYLYGKHTEVDISYMRGYVNVYRAKGYNDTEQFQFEIPQYGGEGTELIAKHTGYTPGALVKVVWDEDFADLYSLDGKFIMTCPRALKGSQAAIETTDEHAHAIGHHLDRKKQQAEFINEFEASLNEVINDLNYEHAMAFGGNKEAYNGAQVENEQKKVKNNSTKQRVQRDFKPSEWNNLND